MHQRTVGGGRPRQPRREKVFRPTTNSRLDNNGPTTCTGRPINGSGIISGVNITGLSGGRSRATENAVDETMCTPRSIIVKHRGSSGGGGGEVGSNRRPHQFGTTSSSSRSLKDVDLYLKSTDGTLPAASSSCGSPARVILAGSDDIVRINDVRHSDYGSAYLDDPLLSKLVSRVLRDDDRDRRLSACRQLKEFVGNGDNGSIFRKAGLGIVQELARVFYERTSMEIKEEMAQCCGSIAVHLGKDIRNYLIWLFRKYDNTSNEEVQILLLQMLLETMKNDESVNKLEFPIIMTHARKVLENTDSQKLLVAIVDIVLVIVDKQPDAFKPHFHDTVDILIGWHIDPQQSESVIRYTSHALISFNQYWIADVQFSVTLLGQLLEDIEAYTEHQNVSEEAVIDEEDLPARITSLIRVYSTVVSSLGDFYCADANSFIVETFSRLLSSVLFACTTVASNNVFVAANNCVTLLLSHVKDDAVQQLDQLSLLIELQFDSESSMTVPVALSLLKLIWKIVLEVNSHLTVDFLSLIMNGDSTLSSLRFMPNNDVQLQLLELYRAIFKLKTVSLLEEAYKHVLEDLHTGFACILKWDLEIVWQPKRIAFRDENESQTAILFDLCAIAEVGSTKNSLIAMLAFNPSIFDLLTVSLKPTDLDLSGNYPSLQYAIVLTIYSYCTNHGHFISSSCLINESEAALSDDRPTTSGHFATILDLLSRLLSCSSYSWSVRRLALKWSQSVIEGAFAHLGQICKTTHFVHLTHSLIFSALNGDVETCLAAGDILFQILHESASNLGMPIWLRVFELCLMKVSDTNAEVREFYLRLFTLLPVGILVSNGFPSRKSHSSQFIGLGLEPTQVCGLQTLWQARRRLQGRSPLGTFTIQDFRTVMAFVLQGTVPSFDSLREMFAVDQRTEKLSKLEDRTLCYLADSNEGVLWFWATYEAALFCVLSKLRTPLGKAQDTLATIEVAIKSFAAESICQSMNESPFGEVTRLGKCSKPDSDPYPCLLRGKLLLNFVESLEKLVYNSYEGCSIALTPPPKAVKTFFRTNKATCREWLGRIRKSIISLALQLGYPAYAVWHGYQLLAEMSAATGNSSSDTELRQIVLMVVQALTMLRYPEPIFGLYKWAKETMGVKLTWVKASIEMAAGHYEEAAEQFTGMLDASAISKEKVTDTRNDFKGGTSQSLDGPMKSFMRNQILESYRRLGSWKELRVWLNSECSKLYSDGTSISGLWRMDTNVEHLAALSKFDGLTDDDGDSENKWMTPPECASLQMWSLSPRQLQQNAEKLLICAVQKSENETIEHCATAAKQITSLLRLSSMENASFVSPEVTMLYREAVTFENDDDDDSVYSSEHFLNGETADMASLLQLLRWVRCKNRADVLQDLNLVAARTARKHQNLRAARRLIGWSDGPNGWMDMTNMCEDGRPPITSTAVRRLRESAKLLRCLGHSSEAVQALSSSVTVLLSQPPCQENPDFNVITDLNARSLLTLVKWFQTDPSLISSMSSQLDDACGHGVSLNGFRSHCGFAEMFGSLETAASTSGGDVAEATMGKLLWMATLHCPWLSKGWHELASWCYRAGKKSVNVAAEVGVELTSEELSSLVDILPQDASQADVNAVAQVLSQVHCVSKGDELTPAFGIEGKDEDSVRRHALILHPVLYSSSIVIIDSLMALWTSITSRVYTQYRMASKAYFTFLKLNGKCEENGAGSKSSPGEDGNVMATLRLLRLMVKHASELRDVLEAGLANTPTSPWKGIIPQLFARLNHPEPYVRRSISDLLCRVTAAAPHLIVFPAVVGSSAVIVGEIKDSSAILGECLSQPVSDDDSPVEVEASPDEGLMGGGTSEFATEETRHKAAIMQNCFAAMVDTLAKRDPRSIAEVQKLVHELRRITLLWDEFWLGTLNQYHLDFCRRITQLEKEIAKVRFNASLTAKERTSLIAKKHETFLKPTLFVLEQLQQVTSQPPETPHEEWFQATFSPLIDEVIEKLKNPATPEVPQTNWQLYKQLLYSLQQRVQKRSNLVLNMTQISPTLATMKSTVIAMPGAPTLTNDIVTIQSVDNVVSIMPTKTKPKKLVFYGSDGKKYPFLFKGLEDLHLDERIMQLLTIVNNMFARNIRRKGRAQHQARHYSVTPLGPRSGLIQWVEGATPLFGLYKRWQQREAVAPVTRNSVTLTGGGNAAGAFLRPSEIFYSKLTPLLKEHGIGNLENRKDWPAPVLRQVLLELMSETPSDLLARELWCASDSALDWWSMTENYAQSTAVMSIIGYIIGLGDRHLDNILVDLETGEVVHIDYNVCFEKGKNLRVPEKVPFRMTPNIRTALGFAGVEGTFRASCEHVLKTLRRGRETLLTLLDAFVYDPLIDWTPGSEGGYTGAVYGGWQGANVGAARANKVEMEKLLVHNMFYIRMVEMKSEWLTNRDDLVAALPKLETLLLTWLQDQSQLQACEEELQALHQEMAFMKEAEANPSHPLHTLHQRCVDYLIVKGHVESSRSAVQEKLADCDHWHRLHEFSLEAVRGPDLPRWRQEASRKPDLSALTSMQVVEFLQAAGKGQLLHQCEQAEKDIHELLVRQQVLLQASLDTLATYSTVIGQAPLNYSEENRIFRWQNWLQELLSDFTLAKCQEIIGNFHSLYGSECGDVLTVHTVMSVDLQLQDVIGDTSVRMHKLCDRLRQENPDNSGLNSPAAAQEYLSYIAHLAVEKGAVSVACVIASALSSHSYRLASLESTVRSAGDQLANFTSRDGDWFLDEFYGVSSSVDELVSLAASVCNDVLNLSAHAALKAVSAWHQVITALQELYLNFRTIILPEALKCLLLGDPSVKTIFMQLESLIAEIGLPLASLVQQLSLQVRHVVMKMDLPPSNAWQLVEHLRNRFKPLIEVRLGSDEASNLSSGQMLLMGFDGLFTKLETDFWQFRELSMPMLNGMPSSWRKVNIIKDARALLSPSFLDEAYTLLGGIFFVKRLQAMTDFFALLQIHCWSLRSAGNGGGGYSVYAMDTDKSRLATAPTLYSEECLAKPIRGFIAEFIGKMLLGLPAQTLGLSLCHVLECCGLDVGAEVDLRDVGAESKVALDDLCRKVVDIGLRQGSFQPSCINQVGEFVANLERLWRTQVLVNRLGQNVIIEKSVLQRAQLQLTFHQWIHEDLLMQGSVGGAASLASPTRSSIMTDMRKNMQGLVSMESSMSLVRERYLSLGNSVEQRLRWAAGANPSISATLEEFELSVSAVNQLIVGLSKVSAEIASTCGSILHFEAFRSRTTEAMTSDNGFLQLINRCQESCLLLENCASVVTSLEEKLLLLKPLEKHAVTSDWIASVTNRIATNIGDVQRRLSQSKSDLSSTAEAVKSQVIAIRVLLGTHHRLMNEVRTILKSMAKYEELQLNSSRTSLRQYVAAYKAYSEHITLLVKEALSEDFTADKVASFLNVIKLLKSGTAPIYDTLLTLGNQSDSVDDSEVDEDKSTAGTAVATVNASQVSDEFPKAPIKIMPGRLATANHRGNVDLLSGASPSSQNILPKIATASSLHKPPVINRDPRTGKAVQERNSYAVSVWKRVKMKLDGRDPDGNKRLTVPEQVDLVISEATSLDNLASLYEGWTPWV